MQSTPQEGTRLNFTRPRAIVPIDDAADGSPPPAMLRAVSFLQKNLPPVVQHSTDAKGHQNAVDLSPARLRRVSATGTWRGTAKGVGRLLSLLWFVRSTALTRDETERVHRCYALSSGARTAAHICDMLSDLAIVISEDRLRVLVRSRTTLPLDGSIIQRDDFETIVRVMKRQDSAGAFGARATTASASRLNGKHHHRSAPRSSSHAPPVDLGFLTPPAHTVIAGGVESGSPSKLFPMSPSVQAPPRGHVSTAVARQFIADLGMEPDALPFKEQFIAEDRFSAWLLGEVSAGERSSVATLRKHHGELLPPAAAADGAGTAAAKANHNALSESFGDSNGLMASSDDDRLSDIGDESFVGRVKGPAGIDFAAHFTSTGASFGRSPMDSRTMQLVSALKADLKAAPTDHALPTVFSKQILAGKSVRRLVPTDHVSEAVAWRMFPKKVGGGKYTLAEVLELMEAHSKATKRFEYKQGSAQQCTVAFGGLSPLPRYAAIDAVKVAVSTSPHRDRSSSSPRPPASPKRTPHGPSASSPPATPLPQQAEPNFTLEDESTMEANKSTAPARAAASTPAPKRSKFGDVTPLRKPLPEWKRAFQSPQSLPRVPNMYRHVRATKRDVFAGTPSFALRDRAALMESFRGEALEANDRVRYGPMLMHGAVAEAAHLALRVITEQRRQRASSPTNTTASRASSMWAPVPSRDRFTTSPTQIPPKSTTAPPAQDRQPLQQPSAFAASLPPAGSKPPRREVDMAASANSGAANGVGRDVNATRSRLPQLSAKEPPPPLPSVSGGAARQEIPAVATTVDVRSSAHFRPASRERTPSATASVVL